MGYVLALWGEFVNLPADVPGSSICCCLRRRWSAASSWGRRSGTDCSGRRCWWEFSFQPSVLQICGNPLLKRGVNWRLLWMLPVDVRDRLCGGKDGVPAWKAGTAHCCGGGGMCLYLRDREAGFIGGDLRGAVECTNCRRRRLRLRIWCRAGWLTGRRRLSCRTSFYAVSDNIPQPHGLLYGRNAEGFISNIGEEEQQVYEEMSSEHPDVARVTEIAKIRTGRYIVFNTSFHQIPEDLTEYGYEKIAVIEDVYAVYSRIGS